MEGSNEDQPIQAAFAAWAAAYDVWELSQRAADRALRDGEPGTETTRLFLEADLLREEARDLFDEYVRASGGRIDSRPGPLEG